VLPAGLGAGIDPAAWERPAVFDWLAGHDVPEAELRRVFNLGIGYCAVIPARELGGDDVVIGRLESGVDGVVWTDA
jgi:phosphoribosylaminoimidazole (AIR) synthetase